MNDPGEPAPPVSPRVLEQLGRTLRSVEGARREDSEDGLEETTAELETLKELVEDSADGSLPPDVPDRLGEALQALDDEDLEEARQILVGVGRTIDDFLKGD